MGYPSYSMLIENKRGNYSFLKGIAPYSAGIVADKGFEAVHVRLRRYVPLSAGFDAIKAHLKSARRPLHAMCGMELRSPKPFSFTGFNQFNAGYIDVLKQWDILLDGINPVARTNVAPELNPPGQPSLMVSPTPLHRRPHGGRLWLREQASCLRVRSSHVMLCGGESPARRQFGRKRTSSWD
jgi:hypothetical protein